MFTRRSGEDRSVPLLQHAVNVCYEASVIIAMLMDSGADKPFKEVDRERRIAAICVRMGHGPEFVRSSLRCRNRFTE